MGTTLVTEFKLNSFEYADIACGGTFYQEKFSNLALQPGDTITLSGSKFTQKRYVFYYGSSPTFSVQYCFYTTLPNGETDKTIEDNELCGKFDFLVTGLREYFASPVVLEAAPNPFDNDVTITSDAIIKRIELLNSLGMLISGNVVNTMQVKLSHPDLASGIYFIKIETEKGSAIRKMIKQ